VRKTPAKKGRGNPAGPPTRGVRGHSTIAQQQGFAEWLETQLLEDPRPTYDEIAERLRSTGFYASRSALSRYGLKFSGRIAETKILLDQARALAGEDDPESTLALEKAISKLAATKMFQQLLGETPLTEQELLLIATFSRLQSSSSSRERATTAAAGKFKAALRVLERGLVEKLKSDPTQLRQVLTLLRKSREEVDK
jgi:hypothetical protein